MELPLFKVVARALKPWHSSSTFSRAFQNCQNHQNPTTIARLANAPKIPEARPVVRATRSYATRSGHHGKKKGDFSNFQLRKVFYASSKWFLVTILNEIPKKRAPVSRGEWQGCCAYHLCLGIIIIMLWTKEDDNQGWTLQNHSQVC